MCGRDFRYSRVRFREHCVQHTEGKLRCARCPESGQEYTRWGACPLRVLLARESLKSHEKRVHSLGRFLCSVPECGRVFTTRAETRAHEREAHLLGLPAKCVSHVCEWCDYAFPTRSYHLSQTIGCVLLNPCFLQHAPRTRWKKHVILCQRGTSRTGFRKQISDVLQWLGRGAYKCTFCR